MLYSSVLYNNQYPIYIQLGFFSRKKHQEIKKKREALEELELTENTNDSIVASTEQLGVK